MKNYLLNALLALDRFANSIMLGSPDETISARAGRWAVRQDRGIKRRVGALICGALDALDPGHCAAARRPRPRKHDHADRATIPYHSQRRADS